MLRVVDERMQGAVELTGRRFRTQHRGQRMPAGQALDGDGWTDVGHGVLDWATLWTAGRAAGAEWMIVEHDEPRRFDEFPRRSFDFLSSLLV